MAQFLRPISDITVTQFNGTFADIDEVSFSDTDFIWSNDNTVGQYECALTSTGILDPITGSDHVISYRLHEIDGGVLGDGGGTAVSVVLSLYQGGTLIGSDTSRTVTGAWVGYTFTLSSVQADAITDYTALRLRFDTSGGGGGAASRRGAGISWAELTFPDPPPQTYNETVTLTSDNTMPLATQMVFESSYDFAQDSVVSILVGNIFDKTLTLTSDNTTSELVSMTFNLNSTLTTDNAFTDLIQVDFNPALVLSSDIVVSDSNITNTDNVFTLAINNTDTYIVGKEFNDTTTITSTHTLETDSTVSQTYSESIILSSKIKIHAFVKKRDIPGAKAIVSIGTFKNLGKII